MRMFQCPSLSVPNLCQSVAASAHHHNTSAIVSKTADIAIVWTCDKHAAGRLPVEQLDDRVDVDRDGEEAERPRQARRAGEDDERRRRPSRD